MPNKLIKILKQDCLQDRQSLFLINKNLLLDKFLLNYFIINE
jgi:hypothetical protein